MARLATSYFPVAVRLRGKCALVAGGGQVAERKVKSLLDAKARVRVVSPWLTGALKEMARLKKISWANRKIRASDVQGADIVVAATSDSVVNRDISRWARRKKKALVNIVDQPPLSDFISPAVLRISKAIIAVYTDGRDPALSRDLKNYLKMNWNVFLSYRKRKAISSSARENCGLNSKRWK